MGLLDSDVSTNKRRFPLVIVLLCVALVIGISAILTWTMPAEHRVNLLFAAIEKQDFPQAFGIWNNDPGWQWHTQQYPAGGYSYGRFVSDWGADSEYGAIKSHKILHAILAMATAPYWQSRSMDAKQPC